MSNKKSDLSDSDLFRSMVGDVKPVEQKKTERYSPPPQAQPKQRDQDEQKVMIDAFSEEYLNAEIQPGDILEYASPGVQQKVLRKLRKGQFRREAEIDLHGMTAPQAREALSHFLHLAKSNQWRCVHIIHGKGLRSDNRSVLKPRIDTWLRQHNMVLAFCSSPPWDGGTGAVYALIKRPPENQTDN